MISKNFTGPLALLIFEETPDYLCGVMAIYIRLGAETPYDLARFIKNTSGFAKAQWR